MESRVFNRKQAWFLFESIEWGFTPPYSAFFSTKGKFEKRIESYHGKNGYGNPRCKYIFKKIGTNTTFHFDLLSTKNFLKVYSNDADIDFNRLGHYIFE